MRPFALDRRFGLAIVADNSLREIGSEAVTELPYESLVLRPDAYHRLFRAAGFESEVFVGYEARADDGEDPILCFVASPRGRP